MKLIYLSLTMFIANSAFANYRCDTINGKTQLLNSEGAVVKTWNSSNDYKACVKYKNKTVFDVYRCDAAADTDTAVLLNSNNQILQSWDREFGIEKDLDSCKRQLSWNYALGAFRCVETLDSSKTVELKNDKNIVQKVFKNTENNLSACRDHLFPRTL